MAVDILLERFAADLPEHLTSAQIAELWATAGNAGREDVEQLIEGEVLAGRLRAEVAVRDDLALGGFREVPGYLRPEIRNGWLDGSWVRYVVHRGDFVEWLKAQDKPLPDGCLLQRWLGNAPANSAGTGKSTVKRTRTDRLKRAIAYGLKSNPNMTANELFDWLMDNDETGTIVDSTPDKLVWTDSIGQEHDINRATFANRVSNLRKEQTDKV
jgi:hypothetical protein